MTESLATDHLFESLGDLGDPDGLAAQQEQQITTGRNMAVLLARFYRELVERGVPELTASELVQSYYHRMLEQEDLAEEIVFSAYDEDDD